MTSWQPMYILRDDGGVHLARRRFLRDSLRVGAVVALSTLLSAAPASAASLFAMPSIGDQKRVGQQAAKDLLRRYKEVHDRRSTHFRDVGKRLVDALSAVDRKNWDFKFHVLESHASAEGAKP